MKVTLENHLRLIDPPVALRDALMEALSLPNPKWIENHRMGRWNRGVPKQLKYYDKTPGGGLIVPRGYLRRLILSCRKQEIPLVLEDRRRSLPPVDFDFRGRLKPYQEKAVEKMLARDFGTLSAPTGSGKTVMALRMIARRRQPALIVVHVKDLALQWIARIGDFLGIAEKDVGFIGGGRQRVGERITVALVQSLYKCAEEIAPGIGFLLVDECHRCPSRTFTEAVVAFDSRYMLGLSATPWRRDQLSRLIFWHLGDVHHRIAKERLVESGELLAVDVVIRETRFKPYCDPVNDYSRMLSELTCDDERNRLIAADVAGEAQSADGVCLVLSDRKQHCETLRSLLKYRHKVSSELLTGDLSLAERRQVLERLDNGEFKVLVATGQLVGEGFDRKDLSTLFLTTPIRFGGRVLQYLGRVLRPSPGKAKARVYDYVDTEVAVLQSAAAARRRVYGIGESAAPGAAGPGQRLGAFGRGKGGACSP